MQKKREKAIAQAVGKAIAKKRMEKGLTQENVAEKLNIGYEAVSRIERGIVTPNIVRLVELAEIFDCEIDELLMNAALRPADHARHFQEFSGVVRTIIRTGQGTSDEHRDRPCGKTSQRRRQKLMVRCRR